MPSSRPATENNSRPSAGSPSTGARELRTAVLAAIQKGEARSARSRFSRPVRSRSLPPAQARSLLPEPLDLTCYRTGSSAASRGRPCRQPATASPKGYGRTVEHEHREPLAAGRPGPCRATGARRRHRPRRRLRRAGATRRGGRRRPRHAFPLEPGDRVALVMRNCAAFVESLFACWHGGWVAVPVNAKLHPREIGFILAHSGARVCFASGDLAHEIAALRPELPELRAVVAVEDADYAKLAAAEPVPIAARAPEDTAWLFYTSGTTGRPKGAMLSHRNLLAMTTSYFVDVDHIAEDDCIIHAAPMSHGSGHVHPAACRRGGEAGHPRERRLRAGRGVRADRGAPGRRPLRGADDRPPPGQQRRGGAGRHPQPEDDRLRRRADVRRGLQAGDGGSRQQAGADLRPGREPDDHHRAEQGRHAETGHPRYEQRLASVGMPHTVVEVAVADADDRLLPPANSARCWCAASR